MGTWCWRVKLTAELHLMLRMVKLYLHFLIRVLGLVLD
jgi:hypothetical protein